MQLGMLKKYGVGYTIATPYFFQHGTLHEALCLGCIMLCAWGAPLLYCTLKYLVVMLAALAGQPHTCVQGACQAASAPPSPGLMASWPCWQAGTPCAPLGGFPAWPLWGAVARTTG